MLGCLCSLVSVACVCCVWEGGVGGSGWVYEWTEAGLLLMQFEVHILLSTYAVCGCLVVFYLVLLTREIDHSAVKLFDDFIKHARHIDAVERYA